MTSNPLDGMSRNVLKEINTLLSNYVINPTELKDEPIPKYRCNSKLIDKNHQ